MNDDRNDESGNEILKADETDNETDDQIQNSEMRLARLEKMQKKSDEEQCSTSGNSIDKVNPLHL